MIAAIASIAVLAGCGSDNSIRGSGTIEMDEVDVASLVGGRVARLYVDEGDAVKQGDTLAVLQYDEVTAGVASQAAQAARAKAQYEDLRSGPRPQEIQSARSMLDAATTQAEVSERDYARAESLFHIDVLPRADYDRARVARDMARANRDSARESLTLLESGYRREQVTAAERNAEAARADLAARQSRARELVLTAPISGVVLLRNYLPGEIVTQGSAVLTLGDPDRLWLRVYVAAPQLPRVKLGARAEVEVHGVKQRFPGRVVEIATESEFTPRAALTEDERANMVFGVKVALEPSAGTLKPGLPADAHIAEGGAGP